MVTARYVPDTGHIVWLQFSTQARHEQSGRKPALVLSPDVYNKLTGLGVFCPITSRIKGYPFEVHLPDSRSINGVVLADQIKSLDWRARKAQFVEQVSPQIVAEVRSKFSVLLAQDHFDWTMDVPEQLEELLETAETFLNGFELVFDEDWDVTKSRIEDSETFISAAGTFIHPNVDDESSNWWHRGYFLEKYRELRNCMLRIRRSVNFS